jgi:hypothetical protein
MEIEESLISTVFVKTYPLYELFKLHTFHLSVQWLSSELRCDEALLFQLVVLPLQITTLEELVLLIHCEQRKHEERGARVLVEISDHTRRAETTDHITFESRVPTQFCDHILDHISFNIDLIFKNEIDPRLRKYNAPLCCLGFLGKVYFQNPVSRLSAHS